MPKPLSVKLVLNADGSAVVTEVRKASKAVGAFERKVGKIQPAADTSASSIAQLNQTVKGGVDHLRRMGHMAVGAVTALQGFRALSGVVETARQFEVLRSSLNTVTGSAEMAEVAFASIQEFAAKTPYSVDQATEAFLRLKNMGLDASRGALESYGNTASAMGKDLMQMVEAVADAATGEFERLKEFGIRASSQGDQVSFTFRGVTTTVKKSSEEIQRYLLNIGNVDFAGAMAERAQTMDGALSNLGDSFDRLMDSIGRGGLNGVVSDLARSLSGVIDSLSDLMVSGQAVEWLAQEFLLWSDAMGGTGSVIGEYISAGIDMALSAGKSLLQFLADLPVKWKVAVTQAAAWVDQGMATIGHYYDNMALAAEEMWNGIAYSAETMWQSVKLASSKAVDWIIRQFGGMLEKLSGIGAAIDFLPGIDGFEEKIRGAAKSLSQYRRAESAVQKEMRRTAQEHDKRAKALADEKRRLDEAYKFRIRASNEAVEAARKEGEEALRNRDRQVELTRELYNAEQAELKLEAAAMETKKAHDKQAKAAAKSTGALQSQVKATKEAERQARNLRKEQDAHARALQNLKDQLDPLERKSRDYFDALEELEYAYENGNITIEEMLDLQGRLHEQFADLGDVAEKTGGQIEEAADPMAKAWESALDRIDNSFADAFKSGFRNFKDFSRSIKDALRDMLAEMAYQLARSKFVQMMGQLAGSGGFWGGLAGLVPGVASAGGGAGSAGGAAAAGAGGYGSMAVGASTLGGVALGAGVGYVGGKLLADVWGGGQRSANMGALGAAIGTAIAPGIGTAIGTALGSGIGAISASYKKKTTGNAIELRYSGGDFSGREREDFKKKSLTWGGNSTRRWSEYTELDDEITTAIDSAMDQYVDLAKTIGEAFNPDGVVTWRRRWFGASRKITRSVESIIENFEAMGEINVKGKSPEEVQAEMQKWVDENGARLLKAVTPQFTRIIDMAGDRAGELVQPLVSLANYIGEDWEPAVRQTLIDQVVNARQAVNEQLAEYDGTVEATQQLSQAVQQRYQLEAALLQQIDLVSQSVTQATGSIKDRIDRTLRTDAEQIEWLTQKQNELKKQLENASDPDEIRRLVQQIAQYSGEQLSMLSKNEVRNVADEVKQFMDEVDALAQAKLKEMEQGVKAGHDQIAEAVELSLKTASGYTIEAAQLHKAAAGKLSEAAAAIKESGSIAGAINQGFKSMVGGFVGAFKMAEKSSAESAQATKEATDDLKEGAGEMKASAGEVKKAAEETTSAVKETTAATTSALKEGVEEIKKTTDAINSEMKESVSGLGLAIEGVGESLGQVTTELVDVSSDVADEVANTGKAAIKEIGTTTSNITRDVGKEAAQLQIESANKVVQLHKAAAQASIEAAQRTAAAARDTNTAARSLNNAASALIQAAKFQAQRAADYRRAG